MQRRYFELGCRPKTHLVGLCLLAIGLHAALLTVGNIHSARNPDSVLTHSTGSSSRPRACQSRTGILGNQVSRHCTRQRTYTVMYAARNDQYLGDSPERLFTCVAALHEYLTANPELGQEVEVIIVDWGSEIPLWRSHHAWRLDGGYPSPLRYLHVPPVLTSTISNTSLSEVHSYNLAARVSCGKYLLRLDQDTLVGKEFVGYMQMAAFYAQHLLQNVWWCGRKEVLEADYADVVAHPVAMIEERGAQYPLWNGNTYADGNGAVGVLGMPRAVWVELQGYNEAFTGWGHMEVELFKRLKVVWPNITVLNIHDTVANGFYHIWHPSHQVGSRADNVYPDEVAALQQGNWGLLDHWNHIVQKTACF